MSIFGKRISGYSRRIESGKCVDVPVLLKIRRDEVIVNDMRLVGRKPPFSIRPSEVDLFVHRDVLERKEYGTFDLWHLYITGNDRVYEFRVQEFEGKAMKRQIEKILKGGN